MLHEKKLLLACGLAVATLFIYAPVLHHEFVNYDDHTYVTRNRHVQAGLSWDGVCWALTCFDHTGYRAFSREVLETLPLLANSDDFLFDNQMLPQAIAFGFRIGEVSSPTRYFPDASSINFRRSVVYGLGVLSTSLLFRLWKWKLAKARLFSRRSTLRLTAYYDQSKQMETADLA